MNFCAAKVHKKNESVIGGHEEIAYLCKHKYNAGMKKLLLIDAYAMIYRAYYAFIRVPRITSKGENTSAIFGFLLTLDDLLKRLQPEAVGVAFDPHGKTFRHEAFEQYKAQRQETPEDIRKAVPVIKEILKAMNIAVLEVPSFEADDVIGTLAGQAAAENYQVYMATPDKDYGQLVTDRIFMYRPRHSGGFEQMGMKEVCEKYGIDSTHQVIDLLALMGDASDNIPGCRGVGEKTAVALLRQFTSVENLLQHTDQLKGALRQKVEQQAEDIRFSYFLATIRTDAPIRFSEQELQRRDVNLPALTALYTKLEFRSLLKKYQTETPPPASPDLFAGTEEPTVPVAETKDLHAADTGKAQSAELDLFSSASSQLSPLAVSLKEGLPAVSSPLAISAEDDALYLSADGNTVYHTDFNEEVCRWLEDESIVKVSANLKQDIKALSKRGITLKGENFDVTVAHYLLQPENSHDLPYLTEVYLKHTISNAPQDRLSATWQLLPVLSDALQKAGAMTLFREIEMPLVPVLADMEQTGVRFDSGVLKEASARLNVQMQQIEADIQALAGRSFNINSPKQVGELLFENLKLDTKPKKTKSGQYITSEEVLLSIAHKHPIVGKILDYRALRKLLNTYIDVLPTLIDPATGKVHTTYNQTITATGRLSSANPNLQNLPIRSERGHDIRRAVIADDGCLFLSADYSQIELRLMAHFSGDEHLIEAFRAGQDIHAATAAKIFHVPLQEVTPDMRRKAKTANFGIIYGISAFGLAEQLQSSRAEAKDLIDGYFEAFPGVISFIEQAKEKARKTGYAETLFGRKRFLPDIHSHNATVRSFAERNAVNAPIQGTAADIIKVAMIRIYRRLAKENLKSKMIMQVHDELNFNVPAEETEQVKQIVLQEMQQAVQLRVPLIADCGVGHNWLEAH